MRRSHAVVALLLLASVGPARAETDVSLYIGKSFTNDSDVRIRQPGGTRLTFEGVSWDDESFEMPIYYGWRVTHYLKPHPEWGVALDFFHYKVFSDTDAVLRVRGTRGGAPVNGRERFGDTIQKLDMSHGVNYLTLNAVRRWRPVRRLRLRFGGERAGGGRGAADWSEVRFQPYAGAGIGAVIPHVEAEIGGRRIGEYQWRGPGFQIFGGVSYRLARRWRLFAEYKFTHTTLTVDIPGGDAHTTLNTHHLVLGGSYRL
jgi:lipid A oxidase